MGLTIIKGLNGRLGTDLEKRREMLENLYLLYKDMMANDWTISGFLFEYKTRKYLVSVNRFVGSVKRKSEYALVKLRFIRATDVSARLSVEANRKRLLIEDVKKLRKYFEIEYSKNLGDIIGQFTGLLNASIPEKVPVKYSEDLVEAMSYSLSTRDSEDPLKKYCFSVRRTGNRSPFNADKTKLLRPTLFKYFENDPGISFNYSMDKEKCHDDITIIENFIKNEERKRRE